MKKKARLVFAAAILVACLAYVSRDVLRARYHLCAIYGIERMVVGMNPPRTFFEKLYASVLVPWQNSRSQQERWKRRDQHEDALVRLGYLSRHEFAFTNETRAFNAVQLMTNARSRFSTRMTLLCVLTNGQPLSSTSICPRSVVKVTAPPNETEKWRALIFEFDQTPR